MQGILMTFGFVLVLEAVGAKIALILFFGFVMPAMTRRD